MGVLVHLAPTQDRWTPTGSGLAPCCCGGWLFETQLALTTCANGFRSASSRSSLGASALTNRLVELTGGRVEPRFARLFLKLAGEVGGPARGGTFIMPLSRQELADLTGTTIETAIRIMSRWGKQRTVVTEKDGFLLLDAKALDAHAAT